MDNKQTKAMFYYHFSEKSCGNIISTMDSLLLPLVQDYDNDSSTEYHALRALGMHSETDKGSLT